MGFDPMSVDGINPTRGKPVSQSRRTPRAGWWFWGPFLWGLFFFVPGIGMLVFGAFASEADGGGILPTGVVFTILGVLGLGAALYAYRDIHRVDPQAAPAGTPSAAAVEDLRAHGVRGHATIQRFTYVAGSTSDGATLVELHLDVTTVAGGARSVVTRSRVPVWVTERLVTGASVPVTVSSTNPGNLSFEWEGLTA